MSRFTEVIVLARGAESVMEPLTFPDDNREWRQCFNPVDDSIFAGLGGGAAQCYAWVIQFTRLNWRNLLTHLESLEWPDPYSVQVLIRDEEDACFGLWMIYEGRLVEVPLPRTERKLYPDISITGVLSRTDESAQQ